MGRRIILASGSPRRKELLGKINSEFEVVVSECDENLSGDMPASDAVTELSDRKALAVAKFLSDSSMEEFIVIGADTVVSLDGKILGKPADREAAVSMITGLSGRSHEVYTGVSVYLVKDGIIKKHTGFFEETLVTVHDMSDQEILDYVDSGESYDKAGGYGIQGAFSKYIDKITGDYFNVVGLPVARLYQEIKDIL